MFYNLFKNKKDVNYTLNLKWQCLLKKLKEPLLHLKEKKKKLRVYK